MQRAVSIIYLGKGHWSKVQNMLKPICVLLCLFSPFMAKSQNEVIRGILIHIDDGDTFTLMSQNKTQYKIRLNGIDCPEKGQDFGKKAKEFTQGFCGTQTVEATLLNKDKYGRNIANVSVNGANLNYTLVAQGLAWHYTKYSTDKSLAKLELEARAKRIHIWSLPNPMAPWVYRKRGSLVPLGGLMAGHVYVCNSTGSKTYHKKMCSGLSRCTKGIKQVSLETAATMNKKACGYCY